MGQGLLSSGIVHAFGTIALMQFGLVRRAKSSLSIDVRLLRRLSAFSQKRRGRVCLQLLAAPRRCDERSDEARKLKSSKRSRERKQRLRWGAGHYVCVLAALLTAASFASDASPHSKFGGFLVGLSSPVSFPSGGRLMLGLEGGYRFEPPFGFSALVASSGFESSVIIGGESVTRGEFFLLLEPHLAVGPLTLGADVGVFTHVTAYSGVTNQPTSFRSGSLVWGPSAGIDLRFGEISFGAQARYLWVLTSGTPTAFFFLASMRFWM